MGRFWRVAAGTAVAMAALAAAPGARAQSAVGAGVLGMAVGAVIASGNPRPYPAGYAGYYAPPAQRGRDAGEPARDGTRPIPPADRNRGGGTGGEMETRR